MSRDMKMQQLVCDGCLWTISTVSSMRPAELVSSTCLHTFCRRCLRSLIREHRKTGENSFHCPVESCQLLIYISQLDDVRGSSAHVETQLESYHVKETLKLAQKTVDFHLDNYRG